MIFHLATEEALPKMPGNRGGSAELDNAGVFSGSEFFRWVRFSPGYIYKRGFEREAIQTPHIVGSHFPLTFNHPRPSLLKSDNCQSLDEGFARGTLEEHHASGVGRAKSSGPSFQSAQDFLKAANK